MPRRKQRKGVSGNPAKAAAQGKPPQGPFPQHFTQSVEAMQERLRNAHGSGYKSGFADGYTKAMEDLFDDTLMRSIATNLFAVHRSPLDQVRYVMSIATKVLRPKTETELIAGLEAALQRHYEKVQQYMTPGIKAPEKPVVDELPPPPPDGWEIAR